MATQPPPPANLPLFYKNLQPLSSNLHAKLKVNASASAPYFATANAIPLTIDEFVSAQRFFPIVFSGGDMPVPLALRLEIVDDGRGVPESLAERIFLPLVSGRAEGSGLGLALAQQVAREHRGSLAYRSRPGHTVFTLLLPMTRDDATEATA